MKIARVEAHALFPENHIKIASIDRKLPQEMAVVEIETDDGHIGHGMTAICPCVTVAALVNSKIGPMIKGMDARAIVPVWTAIYTDLCQRGHTGIAYHALSMIDIALWDIRGKVLGEPVWRLLGGARNRVPCYVTMGLPSFEREQLAEIAKHWVGLGFGGLKIVVGVIARHQADKFANVSDALEEDARRVKAMRDAVGDKIEIAADINCVLDDTNALRLAQLLEPYDVHFIEEPTQDNDPARMADFRRKARQLVATGQSLGGLSRFGAILAHGAADILQPNVTNCGGYTGGLRVADAALAFGKPITNGGGATLHTAHLIAGATNGIACEWHPYMVAGGMASVFKHTTEPVNGWLEMSEKPGLGFELNPDALKAFKMPG